MAQIYTRQNPISYKGIGGSSITVAHFVRFRPWVLDEVASQRTGTDSFIRLPVEALVVERLSVPLILGMRTMMEYSTVVSLRNLSLSLDEQRTRPAIISFRIEGADNALHNGHVLTFRDRDDPQEGEHFETQIAARKAAEEYLRFQNTRGL